MSGPALDIDWTSFSFEGELERAVMEQHEGFVERERGEARTRWQFHLGHDIMVRYTLETGRIAVSGSPHKMVRGESVGMFGPAELSVWVSNLARTLGVDEDQIKAGRLSRIDIAANLVVSAPPCEYIALAESPACMKRFKFAATTATFKNGEADITLYDKIQKLRDRRRLSLLPQVWRDQHVLRVEVRFKKVKREFGHDVTMGNVCDEDFWPVVAKTYHARVSSVGFRRGKQGVPVARDVHELKNLWAARGIMAIGGLDAALALVSAHHRVGKIPNHQLKKQRKAIRELVEVYATGDADLADEVEGLIEQAVGAARGAHVPRAAMAVAA